MINVAADDATPCPDHVALSRPRVPRNKTTVRVRILCINNTYIPTERFLLLFFFTNNSHYLKIY